jgi:hypothetical protein
LSAIIREPHERAVDVAMFLEEVVPGQRQMFHREQPVRFVDSTHLATLEVVKHFGEHQLHLAYHHGVAVQQRLPRHEARVHAAHHNRYSAGSECIRDLVAAIHIARHGRDADEVGFDVEIYRLDILVSEHDLVPVARDGSSHGEQPRERRVEGPVQILGPGRQRIRLGVDQMDDPLSHATPPLQPSRGATALPGNDCGARTNGKPGEPALIKSYPAPLVRNRDFGPTPIWPPPFKK